MKRFVFLFLLLFAVACGKDYPDQGPDLPNNTSEYIAVFGDIQYYTCEGIGNLEVYKQSLSWILEQSEYYNISSVLHVGDVTDTNDKAEWKRFYSATSDLAPKIKYVTAIGDHDYSWDSKGAIGDRNSTQFSDYVGFPRTISNIEARFEAGKMENIVVRNTIHGERYDFLVLEFGPRPEVVKWANEYVSSHPDIKYILINHEYLEKGGGIRVDGLKCVSRLPKGTYTTPEELWNQLIKVNDNIAFVLCGHVASIFAITLTKNDFGREVPQIEHNIQSSAYRYGYWLMLWEFPKDSNTAIVSIINTSDGTRYADKDCLFTFKYRY